MPHIVFIFAVYVLANAHELNVALCVLAWKSGPFGCTPIPWWQADTIHTYTTQQLHNTNMMCTTQCEQQSGSLTKINYEDFCRVSKI